MLTLTLMPNLNPYPTSNQKPNQYPEAHSNSLLSEISSQEQLLDHLSAIAL